MSEVVDPLKTNSYGVKRPINEKAEKINQRYENNERYYPTDRWGGIDEWGAVIQ